jgi:hypothetical protein
MVLELLKDTNHIRDNLPISFIGDISITKISMEVNNVVNKIERVSTQLNKTAKSFKLKFA